MTISSPVASSVAGSAGGAGGAASAGSETSGACAVAGAGVGVGACACARTANAHSAAAMKRRSVIVRRDLVRNVECEHGQELRLEVVREQPHRGVRRDHAV